MNVIIPKEEPAPAVCAEATTSPRPSPTNTITSSDGLNEEGGLFFNQALGIYDVRPLGGFRPLGLRTGFTPPYPPIQIITVFVFLSTIAESFLVAIPALPACIVAPIAGTVHAVLITLTMVFWIRTSIIDPADKRIIKKVREIIESLVEDGKMEKPSGCGSCLYDVMNKPTQIMPKGSSYGLTKFCSLCDTDVHVDSAHCLRCGMCVYRFDHHCSMLNKCIGQANYYDFFRTLVCALTVSGYAVVVHVYVVIELTYNVAASHPFIGKPIVFGTCGAFVSLHLMACFYLVGLVCSHMELRRNNVTLHEHNLGLLKEFPLEPENLAT